MKTKARNVCGLLLAVILAAGFLPMTAKAANAPTTVKLGTSSGEAEMVQGSSVTYLATDTSNIVTTEQPDSWVAKYDGAGTLTLRGGNYQPIVNYLGYHGIVSQNGNLTILLEGDVTVGGDTGKSIVTDQGGLTITGSGTLNIAGITSMGANTGNLTIQGGTINSSGYIYSGSTGGIVITGGNVNATSDDSKGTIKQVGGRVSMTGGTLTVAGSTAAIEEVVEVDVSALADYVIVSKNKDGSGAVRWDKTTHLSSYLYVKIDPNAYIITAGDGSNFTEDSSGNLTFTASGDFTKFTGIKVDGNLVDPSNYTAVSGSTVITLKNEYLQTLSPGDHTISVVYTDGEATASFSVKAQEESSGESSQDHSRPEAYSWGETYGGIRVEKDGGGVSATVIRREGNEIKTIVHPYISAPSRTVTPSAGVYAFDLALVDAYNDYSFVTLKEGPVPVTFYVPGVNWDTPVIVRQWIGNSYVDVPVEAGSGRVTATFSTLSSSTVAIIVGQNGSGIGISGAAGTGMVSPKTGEASMIYVTGLLAMLSLAGMIVCVKKKRA